MKRIEISVAMARTEHRFSCGFRTSGRIYEAVLVHREPRRVGAIGYGETEADAVADCVAQFRAESRKWRKLRAEYMRMSHAMSEEAIPPYHIRPRDD